MPQPAPATAASPIRLETPSLAGVDLAAVQHSRSGGDFFDAVITPSSLLMFMLLDISGRNTEPLYQPLQLAFRARAATLFKRGGNDSEALAQLAVEFNRELLKAVGGVRCTAGFLGCFDPELGTLWYVNAGHTPAIVHDGNTRLLEASGVPLGLFAYAVRDSQAYVLQPGAALALVSKGVIEAEGFGLQQASALVTENKSGSAAHISHALLDSARARERKGVQDHTAVVIVRSPKR
jgi:serine phosphatase RsbU (regulator of sigma subunit)